MLPSIKKDDKDKVKLGDLIRYNYKDNIEIAKLIKIDGDLGVRTQRSDEKELNLKLNEINDVYLLDSNQIRKQLYVNKIKPSYQSIYEFITRNDNKEEMDDLDKFYFKLISRDKFRILDIDKSMMDLILNTDNRAFFRNIFLPSFFINNTFEFGNSYIKGILVYQGYWKGDMINIDDDIIPNDIRIYFIRFDTNNFITSDFDISLRKIEKKELGTKIRIFFQEEKDIIKEIMDRVLLVVCNVIDLIEGNKADLELREIKSSQIQNEKRVKRGKIPEPGKIIIKPKKELLNYIKEFEKDYEKFHYNYKFIVRGHFRHFRSYRYTNLMGEKIWIRPYFKGEGVLIQKPYTLIDEREKEN